MEGVLICWDETLRLLGFVGCPSRTVARPLFVRFSRLINIHFLGSTGAEPHIVLYSFHILLRQLSVHPFYVHVSPITAFAHIFCLFFYVIIFMYFPLASKLPFPSCSCCIVFGVLHYGSGLLLHLILLLLFVYRLPVFSTVHPVQFWIHG